MPYGKLSEVNPSLKGIKPPISLTQANAIAKWADAMSGREGVGSPWAVAIAQFKRLYKAEGDKWVKKEAATNTLVFAQNRLSGSNVRRETLNGREYVVAPVISVCEGVLNDEFVMTSEFGKFPLSWDGRPIVLDHPKQDDHPVSANSPEMLLQYQIGTVFNTHLDDAKLKHDMWIDIALAQQTEEGKEVLRRLDSGEQLEVSTAYFRTLEESPGEFNGAAYAGIVRDLKPDHLAILLGARGACSWDDGCGAPRVNAEESDEQSEWLKALNQLAGAIARLFTNKQQEEKMGKLEEILASERFPFTECELSAFSEEQIDRLHALAAVESEPAANDDEEVVVDVTPAAAVEFDLQGGLDAAFAPIGGLEGLLETLSSLRTNENAGKAALVAKLAANELCVLGDEQLQKLDMETLQGIERSLTPVDYRGNGDGLRSNEGELVAYESPSLFD